MEIKVDNFKTIKKPKKNTTFRIKNSPGQRPEACLILCLNCFKSISLIIVRSQGPRWAKLGGPDNPWMSRRSLSKLTFYPPRSLS